MEIEEKTAFYEAEKQFLLEKIKKLEEELKKIKNHNQINKNLRIRNRL